VGDFTRGKGLAHIRSGIWCIGRMKMGRIHLSTGVKFAPVTISQFLDCHEIMIDRDLKRRNMTFKY
jgi:hypothetical protein